MASLAPPGLTTTEVPSLLSHLKLHSPACQHQLLACYQEARQQLESHDREQQAQAIIPDEASATPHSIGSEDGVDPAVQGALLVLARLVTQTQDSKGADSRSSSNAGLPLSSVASAVGSNLFDVFREWPVVCGKLGAWLEQRNTNAKQLESFGSVCEWQKTLVAVALLSKKYKDLFNKYVHCKPEHKALVLKLGWTLYIVLKAKLLPKFPDLVICMELLVCVMNVLVAHVSQLPPDMPAGPDGAINILDAISDALKADRAHVQQLMLSVNPLFTQQLQNQCSTWLNSQASHPEAPRVHASCTYLPGLLEDAERMATITCALEREYLVHFTKQGEIDERDMLFMDLSRFASPRMTPGSLYRHGNPLTPGASPHSMGLPHKVAHHHQLLGGPQAQAGQRLGPGSFITQSTGTMHIPAVPGHVPFGLRSPMPIMQLGPSTATPISEALGSAAWLRNITMSLPADPTPALLNYFSQCVPNPTAAIAKRVKEMTEAVVPSEQQQTTGFPLVQPAVASYRREEAVKLYYHVLELILASEERMALSQNKTPNQAQTACTTLLTSSKLHKGLMACSLEIVMACYKMTSCPFPRVLELINLQAFDLIRIVQTYVRHMPGMPLDLKRHLYLMEEKTVESLAWQSGSSLYPLIITAQGHTGATSSCSSQHPATNNSAPGNTTTSGGSASNAVREGSQQQTLPTASDPDSTLMSDASDGHAGSAGPQSSGQVAVTAASPSKRPAESKPSLTSPLKRARSADNTAVPTLSDLPALPSAVGRPPSQAALDAMHPEAAAALTWLHDFLRKVLKLAWFRLGFLCQSLSFGSHDPAHVRQKVYDTVEYAVYMHTNLLYNRHLDQVLLSALYGFCKVQHLGQITFKEIISQYRRQPQATQAVFRSVVLTQSNPGLQVILRGDIIAYYNQAFVPLMKQYLLKGEAANLPAPGLPPMPPPSGSHGRQSPRLGPGGASPRVYVNNVYLGSGGGVSPVGSPVVGRPPLPPDSSAVQAAIKQTISGFFPSMPRPSPAGSNLSPKPPHFGQLPSKGMGGSVSILSGHTTAPSWPVGSGSGGSAQPFGMPPPKPAPREPQEREIPSGIATLLRALDTATAADAMMAGADSQVNVTVGPVQQKGAVVVAVAPEETTSMASPRERVVAGQQQGAGNSQSSPEAVSSVSSAGHSIARGLAHNA